MLQAEFLIFKNLVMEVISTMNRKISGAYLNSGKQMKTN